MSQLAIITHRYPHPSIDPISNIYVKELTDHLAPFFDEVHVFAIKPYIPSVLNSFLRNERWKKWSKLESYKYKVEGTLISVEYVSCPELPLDNFKANITQSCFNKYLLKKLKTLSRNRDIIVHGHFLYPSLLAIQAIKEHFDMPTVLTIHGFGVYSSLHRRILPQVRDEPFSDIITVASDFMKSLTKAAFFASIETVPKKIVKVPMGYASDIFKFQRKGDRRNTEKTITFISVGHLKKVKNHILAINALQTIFKKTGQRIEFKIVGDGPLRGYLASRTSKIKNTYFEVKLLGEKGRHDVARLLQHSDYFLFPSIIEGFGIAAVEAMATGLPVIATDSGGPREYITEETGILVDSYDPEDYAEGIMKALERKWDRKKIADYAKQYSWDKVALMFLRLFEKLG